MKKFYDTNALLNLQENILDDYFYISSVSLEELEEIKTSRHKDEETKAKCRKVLKILLNNQDKYRVVIYDSLAAKALELQGMQETPDNKICVCAADYGDVDFITDDTACLLIAKNIFKLNAHNSDVHEKIYKGYKLLKGNTAEINETLYDKDYCSDFLTNEYLLIYNTDDDDESEMRFDGSKFVNLKLPSSRYIKAKNSLQRCALDILNNQDITIAAILGNFGSGKTFLNLRMATYSVTEKGYQQKMVGIREPIGEGRESGYLPGSLDEKLENYFLPLVQNLEGGEYELESLKQKGLIESISPHYLKGTTYNNAILLVDEAEDLTDKQIRLIGTRLGENSRIFFSGDYKQSVINASESNALVRMVNGFKGNPKFGCIYLDADVRSETSQMFANLFD